MTQPEQTTSAVDKFMAMISALGKRIQALERRGTRIPILDDDPDPGDYTNIWMLNDGRLRARNADGDVFEYIPTVDQRPPLPTFASDPAVSTGWRMWTVGGTGALRVRLANDTIKTYSADAAGGGSDGGTPVNKPPTTAVPKPPVIRRYTHVSVWSADDANCYCPEHGVESALYYGRWSAVHGERRLMFGFDATAIRAALTTAGVILKVELKVTNVHSYANSGINIYWGAHNVDTLGASFSQRYKPFWNSRWPKVGGGTWRAAPVWIGTAFRDGLIRGLTVDQPSGAVTYYGQLSVPLQLRITYTNLVP